jgi:hypothetical protein
MTQHWLAISREELVELYNSAFAAMRESRNDQAPTLVGEVAQLRSART